MDGFKARPLTTRRRIADATMDQVTESLRQASKGMTDIHEDTVLYYLHSHAQHLIEARRDSTEELSPEESAVLESGYRERSEIALRMVYYMLIITAEEACAGTVRGEYFFEEAEEDISAAAVKWMRGLIRNGGDGSSVPLVPKSADITLGDAVKATVMCFDRLKWSQGWGGARWGDISRTLLAAVEGRHSLDLMVDHAFTLCHNNGAIFNKGHNYTRYNNDYYTILDIQASGQIPHVIHKGSGMPGITARVKKAWADYAKLFPEEFTAPYDQSKVGSMAKVREAKEAKAQKSAQAFFAMNSAPAVPKGPPKRSSDDIDDMMALSVTGQDFGSMVKSAKPPR